MSDDPSANGADSTQSRQRPSWYIPIEPLEEDRTVQQVLEESWPPRNLKLSAETKAEILEFLEQFRIPRDP